MVTNRGIVRISSDAIAAALKLPPGTKVINVQKRWDTFEDVYELVLDGPEFPLVNEGERYETVILERTEGDDFFKVRRAHA